MGLASVCSQSRVHCSLFPIFSVLRPAVPAGLHRGRASWFPSGLLFRAGPWNQVDLLVLKEVHAGFARSGDVEIAVAVQIHGDELRACASGAVDADGIARELAGFAIDFVVVDNERIVGAGVVAVVAAVALACQQLQLAVAVDVDHLERVHLRERFVDGVLDPGTRGSVTLLGNYLLEPVDP